MTDAPRKSLSRRSTALLAGSCLAVYAGAGLGWISLPGLYYDEAIFMSAARPARLATHFAGTLHLLHWDLPSMLLPYVGALKSWIWLALSFVWAPSVYMIRIPAVMLGGVALLLFYFWVRRFYSPATALLTLALAACDPSYIFTARLDWGPVVLSHVLMCAGLLLGAMWLQSPSDPPQQEAAGKLSVSSTRQDTLLAGAGLCFGLGLWDKATFIWFLAALAASLLILFPKNFVARVRPAACVLFLGGMFIGASPLVIYNLQARAQGTATMVRLEPWSAGVMTNKLLNLQDSLAGHSVYALVAGETDQTSADHTSSLAGRSLSSLFTVSGDVAASEPNLLIIYNRLLGGAFFWLFCLSAVSAPFLAGFRRAACFPFLVAILMWAEMMASKDGGGSVHHFVLAYPLPQLGIAAVVCRLWQTAGRWMKPGITVVLALVLLGELGWDARYLFLFRHTGGRWLWSDAIYQIADFLDERRPPQIAVMDWGFSTQLEALTGYRQPIVEIYSASDLPRLSAMLAQPGALFLLHADGMEAFQGGRKLLEDAAARHGAACHDVKDFFEEEGRKVAWIASCSPPEPRPQAAAQH